VKKLYPVSLGCPKNKVDFEKLLYVLFNQGYEPTLDPEEADVIWINTCAFIRPAVEEALDHIFELGEAKLPHQKLVVSGCLTARYGKNTLKKLLPEVDEFFPIEPYKAFTKEEPIERVFTESQFYAYIKIAEGCNRCCSFCVIPKIRGRLRSRPLDEVVEEAKYLVSRGVKELILVAQDLTSYGKDRAEKGALLKLIKKLSAIPGEFRIRLLYLYPDAVSPEFVEEMLSSPKVVPYFELPIQHAHPKVLSKMNRKTEPERFLKLVEHIRNLDPLACIRSTVIVGFPGEGEEEFEYLCNFLEAVEFDYLGVFIFYPEEGSFAENLKPRVKYKEKVKRRSIVRKLQREITKKRLCLRIGTSEEVLILGEDVRGRPYGIARIQAPEIDGITYLIQSKGEVIPGELVKVTIKKTGLYDMWAQPSES